MDTHTHTYASNGEEKVLAEKQSKLMEDSFRVRVDKTFGTLGTDAPSSVGVNPSLWSLTDEEIERREWIRNKGEDVVESEPSIGGNQLDSDLRDLSDVEEEGEDGEQEEDEQEDEAIDFRSKKRQRNNNTGDEATSVEEYLDVRSNIGRDCTLDYEVCFLAFQSDISL